MQKENLIQISGTVETIIYKNEETGFTVLELDHDGEPLTVVGELSSVGEGEVLTLHGSFRTHPSYGTQFKAVAAEQQLPATASAILRYLASGAIKGIGPVLASRMVAQFGDDTLKVLENEPQRLTEVQGISPAKCEKLREELGLVHDFTKERPFLTTHFERGFDDWYFIRIEANINDLRLQPEEVQDARWADLAEIERMLDSGEMVPYYRDLVRLWFVMKDHRGSTTHE